MSKKISKIVIIGGGSAGWMSAATFITRLSGREIVVIESPNVPTVGVGESTIGGIRNWVSLMGIEEEDFLSSTDASYKLSIKFTDFYSKGDGGFHYPFGFANTQGNLAEKNDWYYKKFKHPETPVSDYADCMFANMALVNSNRISKDRGGKFPGYNFYKDSAFHFDATKFAIWLRDNLCKPRGVKHIQAEVTNVVTSDEGVDYLELDSGEKITADLFIDCTGFKSLLLEQSLGVKFNDYSDILPNNAAWATRVPYKDKEQELVPYTECTAIDNGWVWNIPLWSRVGTGYVYSDKYVSDEKALDEFKEYLSERGADVKELEFKNIRMRTGIHERLWYKNVCAIGLSAGFIEPLESSGLFTVHEFLLKLLRSLDRGDGYVSEWDKQAFSDSCVNMFRYFAEFVALHYALSHRDDTEYWRDVGKRAYKSIDLPGFKSAFKDAESLRLDHRAYPGFLNGLHCIFTGMNYFATDEHAMDAYNHYAEDLQDTYGKVAQNLDAKKAHWAKLAESEPKLLNLLEKIHNKGS